MAISGYIGDQFELFKILKYSFRSLFLCMYKINNIWGYGEYFVNIIVENTELESIWEKTS